MITNLLFRTILYMMSQSPHHTRSPRSDEPLLTGFDQLAGARRIGLLGGSFDPPHIAHIQIAEIVKSRYNLDAIVLIPAQQNPLKTSATCASAEQRIEMLRLALRGHPGMYTSDLEATKSGRSYTVDTLEHIHQQLPTSQLFWIGGTDNLWDADASKQRSLAHWKNPSRILELVDFVTIVRNSIPESAFETLAQQGFSSEEIDKLRRNIIHSAPLYGSSTEIRERLAAGLDASALLDPEVQRYIETHDLYRK